ncbi:MAG: F0F1 ATP synthase subunit B [Atopobiaceae bacterium]|jgi:F-type H+-transporting ATPase subunit b
MNNQITADKGALGAAATLTLIAAAHPELAYAQEISGTDILLPKLSEFIPAAIAFVIIWVLLAKFAWPSIVQMMDARENKIKSDLDEAERQRKEAAEAAAESKEKITEAERQAEQIVADAKREAEARRTQILDEAQKSAGEIIAKAHNVVNLERRKAMVELSDSVVDLSVEIAGKIIGDSLDEQKQREIAEKYLEEVGSLNER